MSDDDPFGEAMAGVEEEQKQEQNQDGQAFDHDNFLETLDEGSKDATIGIAVTEEQRAVWKELRKPADQGGTDTDLAQTVRDIINKQANMEENKGAVERAGRKLEIDRIGNDG